MYISIRATHNSMCVFRKFYPKNYIQNKKGYFFHLYVNQLFSANATMYRKSNFLFILLTTWLTYNDFELKSEHGKLALAGVKQPTSSNMYDLPYFIIGNIKKPLNLVVPSWVRALQPIQQCNAGPWGYLRP